MRAPTLLLLAALLAMSPWHGGRADEAEYRRCLSRIQEDATGAFEQALIWRDSGGGAPALHCAALARLGMGRAADAADRLEALAAGMGPADFISPGGDRRADVLAQAAQAWMIAGRPERAVGLLDVALGLAPEDVELRIDKAVAQTAAGRCFEAIDDLDRALELAPRRADALAFRAACWRLLGSHELAETDATRALRIDANSVDARLERGAARVALGDAKGARADLLEVLRREPEGPAGDAARALLEGLDVKR